MKHNKVLKIVIQKLKYLNYAKRTIESYTHYIEKFLVATDKYPQHIVSSDFQKYLDNYKFKSISQQNQIINAIKFLYGKGLNRKYSKIDFTRPRSEKKIPRVIDKEFLLFKIKLIENIKHKAIISLTYSVGLRVSEVVNLKITDIDSKRMIIYINNAKGRKDRVLPLSENVLKLLRIYYLKDKPKIYLFNGQNSLQYSTTSCNKIVKKYLGCDYHFHLLRHSCFTHLLEDGVDIRIIQKLAGHNSSKTTEIYTHVSNNLLQKINLPV